MLLVVCILRCEGGFVCGDFHSIVGKPLFNVWMQSCSCVAAVSCLGCCENMSSAYDMECLVGWGVGMSCMYKLNSECERTEHCGTPFVQCSVLKGLPL